MKTATKLLIYISTLLFLLVLFFTKIETFAENKKFEPKTMSKKDKYIIASDSSYPPFEFKDVDGQNKGIEVELMQKIAKLLNFNIEMNLVGFDTAIHQLESNQADAVMGGMSITPERKEKYTFSKPYYDSKLHLATKKENPYNIKKYSDLKGKTVGVKLSTAAANFLEKLAVKYNFNVKKLDTSDIMYDSLSTGSVIAIMDDEPVIEYAIKQGKNVELVVKSESVGKFGFAVKKGQNEELIDMFNEGLKYLKETGEYDKIIEKYTKSEDEEDQNFSKKLPDESNFFGVVKTNWKMFLEGFSKTIILALASFVLALVFGIFLGLLSVSPSKTLKIITNFYVDIVRGIPLMVLLFFIFFGLTGFFGIKMPEMIAGILALTLNGAAYISEIVRGGIVALPSGQMEASRSLGLSYGKTMEKIILPQALRIMLPSLVNQFIVLLKDTTIISVIGLTEAIHAAKDISGRNMQPFFVYAFIGVVFLIIILMLTKIAKFLEKKVKIENA